MTRPQEIRKEILLQLYAARPLAKSAAFMAREAKKTGYDYRETEVVAECAFLDGGELIEKKRDGSGEIRYAITHKGILEYENQ
jgi:repressor of nif and glnA expression